MTSDNAPRVLLASGKEVSSWSPEWQTECLERHQEALKVLTFATRDIRIVHLDAYESRLGAVARQRLEAEILRVWELRKKRLQGENV